MLVTTSAASVLAVVFTLAVAGKATASGFSEFRRSAGRLWPGPGQLSPRAQHVLAVGVLVAEAAVAAAMVLAAAATALTLPSAVPLTPAFAAAATLLAAFAGAHALALARGVPATCACFGRAASRVGALGLARTGLLFGASVVGILAPPAGSGGTAPALAALAVLAGCAVGLLLVNLEDVVALFWGAPARPTRLGG